VVVTSVDSAERDRDRELVVPQRIRDELRAHAQDEAPNECCGLIVFRDGRAERYVRGVNRVASPYRYELEIDPTIWFLEDEGYDLAVFHSHPETEPIPSRTDRELAGLWSGKPFLIYGLKLDQLRAWRVSRDVVDELTLRAV
jgi:proteasome lid subunit RPN8/RPN11